MCEVCGATATKKSMKPYKATMDRSGQYIGYNPRVWPGNSEILLCEAHLNYSDTAKANRLAHGALVYLLNRGSNVWLRLVLIVHLVILFSGAFVIFKTIRREATTDQRAAEQSSQQETAT